MARGAGRRPYSEVVCQRPMASASWGGLWPTAKDAADTGGLPTLIGRERRRARDPRLCRDERRWISGFAVALFQPGNRRYAKV